MNKPQISVPTESRPTMLSFEEFSQANRQRCESPKGFNHRLSSWSTSDWITAVLGELGEAANVVKKLNRYRDGVPGNKLPEADLRNQLRNELGDVFVYLDLIAQSLGFSIAEAAVEVFNTKSQEIGYPHKIAASSSLLPVPTVEGICQDCGREYGVWFAPNEIWNLVIPERVGMFCPICFMTRADHAAISFTGWELRPENFSKLNADNLLEHVRRDWRVGEQQETQNQSSTSPSSEGQNPQSFLGTESQQATPERSEDSSKTLAGLPVGRRLGDDRLRDVAEKLARSLGHKMTCAFTGCTCGAGEEQAHALYEYENLKRELASLPVGESRWISVSERLPESCKPVLIAVPFFSKSGEFSTWEFVEAERDEVLELFRPIEGSDCCDDFDYAAVQAWTELPELTLKPVPPGLGESREPLPGDVSKSSNETRNT